MELVASCFRMSNKVLLIGIDEAGYGPILGPLIVSAAAFEVPRELAKERLWTTLQESVSQSAGARGARVAIVDSKKLYKPKEGLSKLERSALTAVAAWRGLPPRLRGLLGLVAPDALRSLCEYDWYGDADAPLPRAADAGGVRIAARLFRQDMEAHAIRIAGLWSEVLPEGHYNRLVTSTQNKAVVLLGLTLRLMQRAADAFPHHEIRFLIDKQGAREHYGPVLLRTFEDRRLRVIEETPDSSAYELLDSRARWQVRFVQSGESCHLATALASILSKYLREMLMGCLNQYWQSHAPALKPTAGYYEDGLRFLRDIQPHMARLGLRRDRLVRLR